MTAVMLLAVLVTGIGQGQVIQQISTGWCSPNIANVTGNVTVICKGVDPRALQRLNTELDKKNLELDQKIQEANQWVQRYHEAEQLLLQSGDTSLLARQAGDYLRQGDLEKAERILNQMIPADERNVERAALHEYVLGLVLRLQFRELEALPHLQKAYQYRPESFQYALDYGELLREKRGGDAAEPVLTAALGNARRLAKTNPAAYQTNVADALNSLGILYTERVDDKKAESSYKAAIEIQRLLSKDNAAEQFGLAKSLNNLGVLYERTGRFSESEAAYLEAINIYRELSRHDPDYLSNLSGSLKNIGNLYSLLGVHRITERSVDPQAVKAESAYREALNIRRDLAKKNPAYQQVLAESLFSMAEFFYVYSFYGQSRLSEADSAWREMLQIYRQIADRSAALYQSEIADKLQFIASAMSDSANVSCNAANEYVRAARNCESKTRFADAAYEGTLEIRRRLVATDPNTYRAKLAGTLDSFAQHLRRCKRAQEAAAAYQESVQIQRALARADMENEGLKLATILNHVGKFYLATKQSAQAESAFNEALNVCRELVKTAIPRAQACVAQMLQNMGPLRFDLQAVQQDPANPDFSRLRAPEAEAGYKEALQIWRELVKGKPEEYEPELSITLNSLGQLYLDTSRPKEAEAVHKQALQIRRKLATQNPAEYRSMLAESLYETGLACLDLNELVEGKALLEEALPIYRDLAKNNQGKQRMVNAILRELAGLGGGA